MKVAFVQDDPGYIGGAELTMREFALAAPDGVDLVPLEESEAVVVGNCVGFDSDLIVALDGKRVVRYFNDQDPHSMPAVRDWLLENAECVFTSPLHAERFPWGIPGRFHIIPPPIDLDAFRPPRQATRNGGREGTVAIGVWQNEGKGQQLLLEWSEQNGSVDVYGSGAFTPHGPNLNVLGQLPPDRVAQTLWKYERFVHLPSVIEPFGRAVVEAWASGCDLVLNGLVGARHWIQEKPEKLTTAAEDFWRLVCD